MRSLIEKEYFTLEEVVEELGLPWTDVIYLAENGHLRLSVLVYDLQVERGVPAGDQWAMRSHETAFSITGLFDLTEADAHRVLKAGRGEVWRFKAGEDECYGAAESFGPRAFGKHDLLIRKAERDRLTSMIRPRPRAEPQAGFVHSRDFRRVAFDGLVFQLGCFQAAVIRQLYEASLTETPWRHGVTLLQKTGCASLRMADLFKSQKNWRALIASNGRGMYRLAQPESDEKAS